MDISDRLEIKLVRAFELPSIDGVSPNAFCEVEVGNDVKTTRAVTENRNPEWNTSPFIFSSIIVQNIESIVIRVKSRDVAKGIEIVLGMVVLPMDTSFNSPGIEIDGKFDILRTSETPKHLELPKNCLLQVVVTYFNTVDPAVALPLGGQQPGIPNMLSVHVSDGLSIGYGRSSVDSFVSITVGEVRKETRTVKKTLNPSWDEDIFLPVDDGTLDVEVFVLHSALMRNVFLGRVRIALNEIAEQGEMGLTKAFPLLNENLQFDENQSWGKLQMSLKWYYDKQQDELNAKAASTGGKSLGFFSRLKNLILKPKAPADDDAKAADETENAPLLGHSEETEAAMDDAAAMQMTPFEWAQYLAERSRAREEEIQEVRYFHRVVSFHVFSFISLALLLFCCFALCTVVQLLQTHTCSFSLTKANSNSNFSDTFFLQ